LSYLPAKEDARQHWSDQDGESERAKQGERHCPCHWAKQATLDRLQREDRHVGRDDDSNRVEDWTLNFMGCLPDDLPSREGTRGGVFLLTKFADNVFDHNHSPVNYHAEIKRTE